MQIMAFCLSCRASLHEEYVEHFPWIKLFKQNTNSKCNYPVDFWKKIILKPFPGSCRSKSYFLVKLGGGRPATSIREILSDSNAHVRRP